MSNFENKIYLINKSMYTWKTFKNPLTLKCTF